MEREAATRKSRVDPKLTATGWAVMPYEPSHSSDPPSAVPIEEWPTTAGPADYALTDDSDIRGVVEAKKVTFSPQGVLKQAERYSRGEVESPHIPGVNTTSSLLERTGKAVLAKAFRGELVGVVR